MKKIRSFLLTSICMIAVLFCAMNLKAEAGNVRTGTLGDNDGITWTYDADTKTLTVTGEDSGLQGAYYSGEYTYKSQFLDICEDVEVIKMQNCMLKGNTEYMFAYLKSLKCVEFQDVNTTNVTNMQYMFYNCSKLISLDLSNFDTSNVTDMSSMFSNCSSLSSLNVSSFNTSNVKDMSSMFGFCSSLSNLDVSNFNTSKVTAMYAMFNNCSSLNSLDVSNFDTSNVTFIYIMFYNCSSLNSLDVSNFDLSKVQAASSIFDYCNNLTVIKTPKRIPEALTMSLPDTFVDVKGKMYTSVDSVVCGKTLYAKKVSPIIAFVERMYTVALGRASESTGIEYWTEELLFHRKDGAAISVGFIMSKEFKEKNYSNEEYLKVLYRTFFDREADADGMNFWLEQMKAGRSRKSVLAGFVNSKEFTEICESYGITRGTMEDDATATGAGQFVERLYSIALERPSDPAGLKDWADRINNRTNTPEQVAKEFFLSPEYIEKNTSNDKYVETLYLVFMDRASESTGKAYWVEQLNNGVSRESVLAGFAQSEEFKEIMARYGL